MFRWNTTTDETGGERGGESGGYEGDTVGQWSRRLTVALDLVRPSSPGSLTGVLCKAPPAVAPS